MPTGLVPLLQNESLHVKDRETDIGVQVFEDFFFFCKLGKETPIEFSTDNKINFLSCYDGHDAMCQKLECLYNSGKHYYQMTNSRFYPVMNSMRHIQVQD